MSEHEAVMRRSNARTRTWTRPVKARQWTNDDGKLVRPPSSSYENVRGRSFPRLYRGSWHSSRDDHVVRPHTPSSAPKEPASEWGFSCDMCVFVRSGKQPSHVAIELTQILMRTTVRYRRTKIICAIAPASWSVEMLGTNNK
ncbi:hypothetical protein PsorP6_014817 [Peronosclerospora sorghi]|uniref:Uncharacterized protein n=1 Tax=Peronosclerospora sorghi TaxID=230839 RepID=A0ACC0VUD9_9STRA|nr:hypothetical protein PsorP6_014817 [Peronosclerospora sorghi]